eukprot:m.78377 g.78377  ORF g.78377 m.78377 type:complete len:80 (+) comp50567_c0_seq1:449-688(+)
MKDEFLTRIRTIEGEAQRRLAEQQQHLGEVTAAAALSEKNYLTSLAEVQRQLDTERAARRLQVHPVLYSSVLSNFFCEA